MKKKYYAYANTNDFGLIQGERYILESNGTGSVSVYNVDGNSVTYCSQDNFYNLTIINL